jgi:hypothetical protein
MKKSRRKFPGVFKVKVGLEALREQSNKKNPRKTREPNILPKI